MGEPNDQLPVEPPERLSPDALPLPFVAVAAADPEPIIVTTNDAFRSVFGDAVGRSVTEWADARTGDAQPADTVCDTLISDCSDETTVELLPASASESTRYRIQPVDLPTTDGYLLSAVSDDRVAVDRLARVISHDLRNPLDVADAHLQAARETGDAEHFEQLAAAHDRMARIIQDVLTLARGEDALNPEPDVAIETVARDAWATVDTGAAMLSVTDDSPRLTADPDRLQRLFENLFRNSVEHGTSGSQPQADDSLTVTVGRDDKGFFISDNGVGIPVADRQQVFDSGYVSGDSGGGTGLGLTIVEEIADAHDWQIELTESDNGGARFAFYPRSKTSTT
ncbi:MAG: signal transduction histidine kinase [Halonotius sp. J07HN4]|jgi:Signal transduction histidine kinase|nr:MAG: signal transduction histidine kinase [Halonotius sp. J07HN4]